MFPSDIGTILFYKRIYDAFNIKLFLKRHYFFHHFISCTSIFLSVFFLHKTWSRTQHSARASITYSYIFSVSQVSNIRGMHFLIFFLHRYSNTYSLHLFIIIISSKGISKSRVPYKTEEFQKSTTRREFNKKCKEIIFTLKKTKSIKNVK